MDAADAGGRVKRVFKHAISRKVANCLLLVAAGGSLLLSQQVLPDAEDLHHDHILGIVPNYQTVTDPHKHVEPLTPTEKFRLFAKETLDPFVAVEASAGAGLSQTDNDDPKYGYGARAYTQRLGAAVADITSQNFFSDGLMASLLHEDPRYFRMGPEFPFWRRLGHAVSRVVITRTDSGKNTFNYAGILGMSMGIALSNAYYPDASVNAGEVGKRFGTSLAGGALLNILPEFWPDIRQKFLHRRSQAQP